MPDIFFGCTDETVLVRVAQKGTWEGSLGLSESCRRSIEGGIRRLIVDLSECDYVDSTFSGMLVDLAFAFRDDPTREVRLYGVRGGVRETLSELGLLRFFEHVEEGPPDIDIPVEPLPARPKSSIEQADHVAHAHEQLMEASNGNVPKFAEIVKTLRAEAEAKRKANED